MGVLLPFVCVTMMETESRIFVVNLFTAEDRTTLQDSVQLQMVRVGWYLIQMHFHGVKYSPVSVTSPSCKSIRLYTFLRDFVARFSESKSITYSSIYKVIFSCHTARYFIGAILRNL